MPSIVVRYEHFSLSLCVHGTLQPDPQIQQLWSQTSIDDKELYRIVEEQSYEEAFVQCGQNIFQESTLESVRI